MAGRAVRQKIKQRFGAGAFDAMFHDKPFPQGSAFAKKVYNAEFNIKSERNLDDAIKLRDVQGLNTPILRYKGTKEYRGEFVIPKNDNDAGVLIQRGYRIMKS